MHLPKPQIDRDAAMRLWIKDGSDYAKEQLALNNVGIIGIVLKSLNLNPLDDDLLAVGLVGLVKAINTFKPEKGFAFSTYVAQVVRNEISKTFRKKRIFSCFSLDEPCRLENGEESSYTDIIADDRRFEEEVVVNMQFEKAFSFLSEREKMILYLKINYKTQTEIGRICGISQAQASREIKKIYEKLKREFNENG